MGSSHRGPAAVASWKPWMMPASTLWQSLPKAVWALSSASCSGSGSALMPGARPSSVAASRERSGTGRVCTQRPSFSLLLWEHVSSC